MRVSEVWRQNEKKTLLYHFFKAVSVSLEQLKENRDHEEMRRQEMFTIEPNDLTYSFKMTVFCSIFASKITKTVVQVVFCIDVR